MRVRSEVGLLPAPASHPQAPIQATIFPCLLKQVLLHQSNVPPQISTCKSMVSATLLARRTDARLQTPMQLLCTRCEQREEEDGGGEESERTCAGLLQQLGSRRVKEMGRERWRKGRGSQGVTMSCAAPRLTTGSKVTGCADRACVMVYALGQKGAAPPPLP